MNLRLGVALVIVSVMQPVLSSAGEIQASYLLIRHVGSQDRPIPSLQITADKEIAALFLQRRTLQDFTAEKVFTRMHLLDEETFSRVESFFARESTKPTQPERALEPLREAGTFEISARTKTGEVTGFYFVTHHKDSLAFLRRLSRFLSAPKSSTELQGDVNFLIQEID